MLHTELVNHATTVLLFYTVVKGGNDIEFIELPIYREKWQSDNNMIRLKYIKYFNYIKDT